MTSGPASHLEIKGWWRRLVADRVSPPLVSAASSAISATAILISAGFYGYDWVSRVTLTIEPPLVIEVRCSRGDFDAARCMDPAQAHESHLSITAALRTVATGPSRYSATIDRMVATVQIETDGPHGQTPLQKERELQAFWSVNLTPGREEQRSQIVPLALAGGESVSREIWFMPVARLCGTKTIEKCEERGNFLPWVWAYHDIGGRSLLPDTTDTPSTATINPAKRITVRFSLDWHDSAGRRSGQPATTTCNGELGTTIQLQYAAAEEAEKRGGNCDRSNQPATMAQASSCRPDPRRLAFTIACREAQPSTTR